MYYKICLYTVLLVFLLFYHENGWAQTVPTQAEPQAIDRQLDEVKQKTISPPTPTVAPTAPDIEAPEGAEAITFILNDLVIEGVTVFGETDFIPIFEPFVGKEITLKQIYGFAAQITQLYQQAGYLFSYATIKPQKIIDGVVTITVIEGKVSSVDFDGTRHSRADIVNKWEQMILNDTPTRSNTIQTVLSQINALPGMRAEFIYKPQAVGEGTLLIILKEDDFAFIASVNNRGTRFVGPLQQSIYLYANNQLGFFEQIMVSETTSIPSSELKSNSFSTIIPISAKGDRIAFDLVKTFQSLDFPSATLTLKATVLMLRSLMNIPLFKITRKIGM